MSDSLLGSDFDDDKNYIESLQVRLRKCIIGSSFLGQLESSYITHICICTTPRINCRIIFDFIKLLRHMTVLHCSAEIAGLSNWLSIDIGGQTSIFFCSSYI